MWRLSPNKLARPTNLTSIIYKSYSPGREWKASNYELRFYVLRFSLRFINTLPSGPWRQLFPNYLVHACWLILGAGATYPTHGLCGVGYCVVIIFVNSIPCLFASSFLSSGWVDQRQRSFWHWFSLQFRFSFSSVERGAEKEDVLNFCTCLTAGRLMTGEWDMSETQ